MPDPREAKLPKWAQAELRELRRQLADETKRVRELRGDNPDSDTFLIDYGRTDFALPRGARIGFHTQPDDGRVRKSVQVYADRGALHVHGDYLLTIHPRAANSFTIRMDQR